MTTASTPRRSPAVEVHLVTGAVLEAVAEDFTPANEAIALTVGGERRQEPTENVAWIAFKRADGSPSSAPSAPPGAEVFRVQVAGGRVLMLRALPEEVWSERGFFGVPTDDADASAEVFVFAHGMNSAERDLPLAASLMAEGLLDSENVPRAAGGPGEGRKRPIGAVLADLNKSDRPAIDEAVLAQRRKKMRLGDLLVESAYVTQAEVDLALAEQKRRPGKRLGEVLVEIGILSELDLARSLSAKFQLPLIDLDTIELNPAGSRAVPREIMSKYGVLPVDIDANVLTVAIADPMVTDAIDMLRFQSRMRIRVVLVTESQLRRAVGEALRDGNASQKTQAIRLSALAASSPPRSVGAEAHVDASRDPDGIVRLVNQLILAADQRGASDVHLEPSGDDRPIKVRYRIDGRCVAAQEIPGKNRSALAVRLKVMAGLDIAERRRPQDGKLRVVAPDGRNIDIRVTTIPTVDDNEDFVLRLLLGSRALGFDDLLLSPKNADAARAWMTLDHGLLLCVGPTGVGKTTTVHGLLSLLDTTELKVWTAEDPVEIVSPGLRQLHVQPKIDVTFAAALRSFLRADPDVIMIGEMRDLETAALAVEASLTGHLVLSTLHTKSAVDTIARLLDMGLEPFTVADALSGILSQRLVRKLCMSCKASEVATEEELASIERLVGSEMLARTRTAIDGVPRVWRAVGCEACAHSGYAGRIAIHEALTVTDEVRPHIGRRATAEELRRVVGAAMTTMREDGLWKAFAGHTDLREVLAVT